jgi:nucleoside-diphosphate-sugar epimerase
MAEIRHLIVTGAGGYLGRGLVAAALAEGRAVTALGRGSRGLPAGLRVIPWSLGDPLPAACLDPALPPERQGLVHLAHDWRERAAGDDRNRAGTRLLRDGARALGLGRIVFASSQSARADAANAYGRAKWAIEQLFDAPGELSLRIGLVYGGPPMAQYGLLRRLARLPVIPMVAPGTRVQPIHRSEVARGILLGLDGPLGGAVGLAGPVPVTFGDVLTTLAAGTAGRRPAIVPIPLGLALLGCAALNAIPFGPRVDRERILGLAGTRPMPTAADLARLGLRVRPLADGLLGEPAARRALLDEGRILERYVLRARPGGALVRRYVRALTRDGAVAPLALPLPVRAAPGLLRFVEPLDGTAPLARRLALAARLVEASPAGEAALGRPGRARRLAGLAADGAIEALAMPVRATRALLR